MLFLLIDVIIVLHSSCLKLLCSSCSMCCCVPFAQPTTMLLFLDIDAPFVQHTTVFLLLDASAIFAQPITVLFLFNLVLYSSCLALLLFLFNVVAHCSFRYFLALPVILLFLVPFVQHCCSYSFCFRLVLPSPLLLFCRCRGVI